MDTNKKNLLIVSLSGGVDSMVILYILHSLNIQYLDLVAVHLDYHNRSETGLEAEFLFRYCELLKIPLYYKYIHEGTRNRKSKEREEYEETTKNIRFNLYKNVENIYTNHNKIGVILGHHKGDLQENIFFNLMKGRTLTDLSVIKEDVYMLGINILRPLLCHPKSDIFDFAHKNNIPYFKNTTPVWSNRGKYRNTIEPSLIDTFGNGVLTSLSKISTESDELSMIINKNIIEPYFTTITVKDKKHYLPKTQNQPFTYWKYILHEWCHRNNMNIISHKLLMLIYTKINQEITVTCSNTLKVTITNEYIIIH
jgi:tRNA(Ile)-lysidine synthetase-like protein